MKKLLAAMLLLWPMQAAFAQTHKVDISFDFNRQGGFSSNQFAVWIEDINGNYVKTLYATSFTAKGGWQRREQSLPRWVRQSNLAGKNNAQIDALTGPTPRGGPLRYSWDGTDIAGRPLPPGEYRASVEATLRSENQVLYTAMFRLGERGQANAQAQYFGSGTRERNMIGPVTVLFQ
jgi:hypothetical protein